MPLNAVLKVVNVFLALTAFLVAGITSLAAGEELYWAVGKAVVSFFVCWIVMGWLVAIFLAVDDGKRQSGKAPNQNASSTK